MEINKTQSQQLTEALTLPNGARFYRCALQVNPFSYHGRHGKQNGFQTEADYGRVHNHHMGSIDLQAVREMVEEILEGGKTAFEMRRQKYGF